MDDVFLLTNGSNYAMSIFLVGSPTWMTNDVVEQKLHDMGFINIDISLLDSSTRYAIATWNGETGADPSFFPEEISDLHEM